MVVGESSLADRTGTQFVVTAGIVAACRSVRVVTATAVLAALDPRTAVSVDCGAVPYRVSIGDRRPQGVSDAGGVTSVAQGQGRITVSVEF
jgi:hypothetical protein